MNLLILLIFGIINFIGLYQYGKWSLTGVPHKTQALIDFIAPVGCIMGRILFHFDMKTNKFAYIYGLIFSILILVLLEVVLI